MQCVKLKVRVVNYNLFITHISFQQNIKQKPFSGYIFFYILTFRLQLNPKPADILSFKFTYGINYDHRENMINMCINILKV